MKARLKHWITSVIGIILLVFTGLLIWKQYDTIYIILSFGFGLGLLYAKDDLIKKLLNKI